MPRVSNHSSSMFRLFARAAAGVLLFVCFALRTYAADVCAPPRYNVAPTVAAGTSTVSVAVGDFNRDGLGDRPGSTAVTDFNGDGKLDLAVVNQSLGDVLSLFTGSGDGRFTGHASIGLGFSPSNVIASDFNNDGAIDFGVSINRTNRVTILLGDGAGTFAGPFDSYAGASPSGLVDAEGRGERREDRRRI